MGDGTRLALAIAMMFLAMLCFFVAFHPGGIQGVSDPDTMLEWLMGEFNNTASTPGASTVAPTSVQPTPSGNPSTNTELTGGE
jgi:hypothetical protein